jgi:hypothetical protein
MDYQFTGGGLIPDEMVGQVSAPYPWLRITVTDDGISAQTKSTSAQVSTTWAEMVSALYTKRSTLVQLRDGRRLRLVSLGAKKMRPVHEALADHDVPMTRVVSTFRVTAFRNS